MCSVAMTVLVDQTSRKYIAKLLKETQREQNAAAVKAAELQW
jgi:hypothetical protein